MIALCTRWTSGREGIDPRRLLPDILDLGFQHVALDGRLPRPWLAKMRPEIESGAARVVALTGFVPVPVAREPGADPYGVLTLVSEDPSARDLAERLFIDTIHYAADVECPTWILPLGRVEIDERREAFERFWREERIAEEEGVGLKEALYRERSRPARRALDRARRGLDAILREADRLGVTVTFATPEGPGDLPAHGELEALAHEYAGAPIGYWHHPARAVLRERFGWEPESRWLDAFGPRLRGVTLGDLDGTEIVDLPAGEGGLGRRLATPGAMDATVRVLDPDPTRERSEIRDALAYLADLGLR